MKLYALAALLGLIGADTFELKKDQIYLRDDMKSLLTMVEKVETQDADMVLDAVDARKEKLKILLEEKPERADAISNEFKNLLHVVEAIEEGNYDGAMDELEVRKDELMEMHQFLLNAIAEDNEINMDEAADAAAKEKADKEKADKAEADAKAEKKKEDDLIAKGKEFGKTNADLKKAWTEAKKKWEDAKAANVKAIADRAALADDAAAEDKTKADTLVGSTTKARADAWAALKTASGDVAKKNVGLIVFACIAGIVVIGGIVYYVKSKNEDKEGGDNEARTLFKTQIKKNKPQKEQLV